MLFWRGHNVFWTHGLYDSGVFKHDPLMIRGIFWGGSFYSKRCCQSVVFVLLRAATLRFASSSRFPAPVTRPGAPGSLFPASPAYFAHRSHGAQRQQVVLSATLQKISDFFFFFYPPRLTFLPDDLRFKNIFSAKIT